jgi:alginate O-acetyltransferase complex protein AlgI
VWLKWFVTFHLIVFGWILFRSESLHLAGVFLSRLFTTFGAPTLWSAPVVGAIVLVVGLQLLPERPLERIQVRIERLRPALLAVGLAIVIVFAAATVPSQGVPPFIYFRF